MGLEFVIVFVCFIDEIFFFFILIIYMHKLQRDRFVWGGMMLVLIIRILRNGHKEVELMVA